MAKELIIAVFDGVDVATKAAHDFNAISEKHVGIHLDSCVLVQRDDSGAIHVLGAEGRSSWGEAVGVLTGGLLGMLGGPVGVAAGLAVGTRIAQSLDARHSALLDQEFTQAVSDALPLGGVALIAEAEERTPFAMDNVVQGFRGRIFRKALP